MVKCLFYKYCTDYWEIALKYALLIVCCSLFCFVYIYVEYKNLHRSLTIIPLGKVKAGFQEYVNKAVLSAVVQLVCVNWHLVTHQLHCPVVADGEMSFSKHLKNVSWISVAQGEIVFIMYVWKCLHVCVCADECVLCNTTASIIVLITSKKQSKTRLAISK